jgi:D-3-phosphoglycerate dehydrogenase/(S)-sulfolactate dehydrogenase
MKIIVCDPTESSAIERMRLAGLTVDVRDTITPEELNSVLKDYDGMVVRSRTKVRAPSIDLAPNLKVIVRGGVGLDTIDADYARSKGIGVMNTPLSSSASVAELAIGFMIALARAIPATTASMRAGKWEKKKFEGDEIGGKTLGVVGTGAIGQHVAHLGHCFGMDLLGYDPQPVARLAGETGLRYVELPQLLAGSDVISLHAPLMPATEGMIGAAQLARMKRDAVLINTARGALVDSAALADALRNGRLGGAAIDVLPQEPPTGGNALLAGDIPNLIVTPHIAWAAREARQRCIDEMAANVEDFRRGGRRGRVA